MNTLSTSLEMSAASIRLAGYMIENNLRVARIFGQAAMTTYPFAIPSSARTVTAKPAALSTRKAKPVAKRAAAKPVKKVRTVKSRPTLVEPVKAEKQVVSAKPATKSAIAKPAKAAVAKPKSAAKTTVKPDAKPAVKVTAKPAIKAATSSASKAPEFKSQAARVIAKAPELATPAPKPAVKTAAPSPKVEPAPQDTSAKRHRAPATPPGLPSRNDAKDKG